MSDEQKFMELLKELGKIIKEKNDIIVVTGYQLSDVRKRLKDFEEKEKEE